MFGAVLLLCALLAIAMRKGARYGKEVYRGLLMVRQMNQQPDDVFQSYQRCPTIKLRLPIVPVHVFLISPNLIRKFFANSSLDSLRTKRELSVYVFGMPITVLDRTQSMFHTVTAIENMYHHELSTARMKDALGRFESEWQLQLDALVSKPLQLDISFQLYDMMVVSATRAFFGADFPAELCLDPIKGVISNLASATFPSNVPWPMNALLHAFLPSKGRVSANQLVDVCAEWLSSGRTSGVTDLITKTANLAAEDGWTERQQATMYAMLLFTVVANSSDAIGWLVTCIVQAPKAFEQIQAEIDSLASVSSIDKYIGNKFATCAPYLFSATQETLRVFTAPLSVRVATRSTTLRDGEVSVEIEQNWRVIAPTRAMNVDPKVWGEDARDFKCSRFLGTTGVDKVRLMAPFGGGSSICTGRHFAVAELAVAVTHLLNRYSITWPDSSPELPIFDMIDIDSQRRIVTWAGAIADPNSVQSGIFRASQPMVVGIRRRSA